MTKEEIKPCHCEYGSEHVDAAQKARDTVYFVCMACNCQTEEFKHYEQALKAWNTRA